MNRTAQYALKLYEQARQQHGIKASVLLLEEREEILSDALKELRAVLKRAQQEAVDYDLATWTFTDPKELAPTKQQFIDLFGMETFNKVKREGAPTRIFTWRV